MYFSIIIETQWSFSYSLAGKPGECPVVDADAKAECPPVTAELNGCLLDTDCPGSQKCCTDGCTLICTTVVVPTQPPKIKGEPGDPGEPGEDVSII